MPARVERPQRGPAALILLPRLGQPLPFAVSEAGGTVPAGSPTVHDGPSCKDTRPGPVAAAVWRHGPVCVLQAGRDRCSAALLGQVPPPTLLCPVVLQIAPARHRDC